MNQKRPLELLRELPPELDLPAVQHIIQRLPTLPPPQAHWTDYLYQWWPIGLPLVLLTSFFWRQSEPQLVPNSLEAMVQKAAASPSLRVLEYSAATEALAPVEAPLPPTRLVHSVPEILPLQTIEPLLNTKAVAVEIPSPPVLPRITENAFPESKPEYATFEVIDSIFPATGGGYSTDLFGATTTQTEAIQRTSDRFAEVPLGKLRRTLRRNLLQDGLIHNRKDTIDLWLSAGPVFVNGTELMPDKTLKYHRICAELGVGSGDDRHVKIHPSGIAVGDFTDAGFRGTAQGTFRLNFIGAN